MMKLNRIDVWETQYKESKEGYVTEPLSFKTPPTAYWKNVQGFKFISVITYFNDYKPPRSILSQIAYTDNKKHEGEAISFRDFEVELI